MTVKSISALAMCFVTIALGGCTRAWYAKWADQDAYGTIREGQAYVLGENVGFDRKNSQFSIEYAPVDCRAFLQKVESEIGEDRDIPAMTLENALAIAFKNSRAFQSRKETLYSSALSLATLSRGWETVLFDGDAGATAEAIRTGKGGPEGGTDSTNRYLSADGNASLSRRIIGGGLLTLGASMNYTTNFLGLSDTEVGSLVSGSFTQPLLRGAWRGLAFEGQHRRERNFFFDVFEFSRFRQTFAVSIMQDYYNVLRNRDQVENSKTTVSRLQKAYDMTRTLVQGGQIARVQEDQAEQDLLNAQIALEVTLLTYSNALDSFKITLGLPISTEMRLNYPKALVDLNKEGPKSFPLAEGNAVNITLSTDTTLMRARARARDTGKDVEIAADQFNPGLDLELGISAPGTAKTSPTRIQTHHHTRNAKLTLQYGLDQTSNRDVYRNALILRDSASRNLARAEDTATLNVRNSFRSLKQSKQSFSLQARSVAIARRRTTLVTLRRKEGQASARDVTEAERARTLALNGLTNSLINYTMTRLNFLARLGMLDVDNEGRLEERKAPFGFDRLQKRYAYLLPGQAGADARAKATIDAKPKRTAKAEENGKSNE